MRLQLFLLLSTLSASVCAAEMAREAPPPPPLEAGSDNGKTGQPDTGDAAAAPGPEVTITKETEQTIEEYRVGGRLYMIKITPKHGKPYYMVDDRGDGKFVRQDTLDNGFRPPRWIIHSW